MSCVYVIINNVNGKMYVGQTISKLGTRLSSHRAHALRGAKQPIAVAIRKYGWENFSVEEIPCPVKGLNELEADMIKRLDTVNTGYNVRDGVNTKKACLSSLYVNKELYDALKAFAADHTLTITQACIKILTEKLVE